MGLLADAMSGVGAALLPVAAALLFEELTFGGLVRLLLAPWPGSRKDGARRRKSSAVCGRVGHKNGTPKSEELFAGNNGCGELEIRKTPCLGG